MFYCPPAFHGFIFPSDGIVDDQDNFYVVDSKAKKVRVFNANRDELFSFGKDMLFYPTAIAFDKKNQRLLVAEHGGLDFRNIRLLVHIFTKQGIWQSSIAQFGWLEGEIARIQGLAVDNAGRVYIADTFLGIVTVLDENGRYITTIGDYGTEPGEMRSPMDIAIDSQNRLWITSKNNRRLEVFRIEDPHLKNSTSNIEQDISHNLLKFQLLQNFPNPFNPQTEIPFVLENDGYVTISIYSEIGQIVRRFDLGYLSAGNASVLWNATNNLGQKVASGIYLYEIRVNEFVAVRRMLLMR